jgi:formylglycine-generating enzyme required for sulfatase activity
VDARIQGETGIRAYGVQADEVVAALASAAPRVSVVILDACRDNPYAGAVKSGTKGLARMEVNTDQELLIAYATRDGQVALDGKGNNSPYAVALAKHLRQAGQRPLLSLFDQVADQVRAETGNQQRPTRYGDLKASTYLLASLAPEPPTPPRPAPNIVTSSVDPAEAAYWAEVKKSEDADDYAAYLAAYPNGLNMADANEFIERDKQAKAAREKLKEDQAWQKAQSGDTQRSYEAYLKDYPSGRYASLAKLKKSKAAMDVHDIPYVTFSRIEPEMVRIPGKNYEIGKYEVTQAQWRSVMKSNPSESRRWQVQGRSMLGSNNSLLSGYHGLSSSNVGLGSNPSEFEGCDDCPVEYVSWNDIQDYLKKLNQMTGQRYRLPTEAEWKHACDGGREQEYCGSNNVDAVAWHKGNSGGNTHPVGQKQANGYGLYDMSGNVWEWMQDCSDGDWCVLRGGSWFYVPGNAHSGKRDEPAGRLSGIGFRLARDAKTY